MRLDDRLTIATPEGVTLDLVLAGLGSRFVARLLDTVIQGALIFALAVGAYAASSGVVRAIAVVVLFLTLFAYDIPFEVLNGGRTVGKLAAGVHVVGRGGEPIGFLASVTRNVLRIVDFLPGFYVVGAASIVATQRDQRLGDLAAGTMVVRDKFPGVASNVAPPITVPADAVTTWDVSALTSDEVTTVRHFLDRRLALDWPVRTYFGTALAAELAPKIAGAPYGAHPEYLLEGIVIAKQGRS